MREQARLLDSPWAVTHPGQAWGCPEGEGHQRDFQPRLSTGVTRGGVSPRSTGEKIPQLTDKAPTESSGLAVAGPGKAGGHH